MSSSLTLHKILLLLSIIFAMASLGILTGCAGEETTSVNAAQGTPSVLPNIVADRMTGGLSTGFLHLDPVANPPFPCDATGFGTIAMQVGGGLCVCQPHAGAQQGNWVSVAFDSQCWVQ